MLTALIKVATNVSKELDNTQVGSLTIEDHLHTHTHTCRYTYSHMHTYTHCLSYSLTHTCTHVQTHTHTYMDTLPCSVKLRPSVSVSW